MYWHEDTDETAQVVEAADIVDLAFRIDCRALPVDHAHALSQSLAEALPWLLAEEMAGMHIIHGAGSQNGWYRPEETEGAVLHLSRRTRMTLRLPRSRVEAARALTGTTLVVAEHPLAVGEATVKSLEGLPTLFSRYVVADEAQDEETFVHQVARQLMDMGIPVKKILCGKSHALNTPAQRLFTRSVMVADLSRQGSIRLQQEGLGPHRKMGCGLFVPHKGIAPVKKPDDS